MKRNDFSKGEHWPFHYRGSRYTFTKDGIYYGTPETHNPIKAVSFNQNLLTDLIDVKSSGGSFRITETKQVTAIAQDLEESPKHKYVCEYDDSLRFEGVELNPGQDLKPGDIWPGFYYMHGSRYSLGYYDEIFWRGAYSHRIYVQSDHEHLISRVRFFKPHGGRFYVNEHGKVWTNSDFLVNWRRMQKQVADFSPQQKELLEQRYRVTGLYPVYVCDFADILILEPESVERPLLEEEEHPDEF